MNRSGMFDRLRAQPGPWDIIVIGGGATGVGAVDAATRGYGRLLLERTTSARARRAAAPSSSTAACAISSRATSRWSWRRCEERGLLRQNAPHLVSNLPFVVPNYDWWEGPFYGLGLKLYNLLAGQVRLRRIRRSSRTRKRSRACQPSTPTACAAASSTTTASSTTRAC